MALRPRLHRVAIVGFLVFTVAVVLGVGVSVSRLLPLSGSKANLIIVSAPMPRNIILKSSPSNLGLYAGETNSFRLVIINSGTGVTFNLSVTVISFPKGGSASDIVLSYPTTIDAPKGTTTASVVVSVSQQAFLGTYVVSSTLSGG